MLLVQCITQTNPNFFSDVKGWVELAVTIIGGYCALKGISYIDLLRKRKALSTFSFEAQLYVRIYEMSKLVLDNDSIFTNLFSEEAYKEWSKKSSAPQEKLDSLYEKAEETLEFIKSTSNQLPVYASWGEDYRELIKYLVDITHYDIRSSQKGYKFTVCCPMEVRKEYCDSFYTLLDKMMVGIEKDQNEAASELF